MTNIGLNLKIAVCIFDVNGVLIDSNLANARAMAQAFTDDPILQERIAQLYLTLTGIDRGTKIRKIQEQMIAAAKIANAHYFVSRLPHGYDTVLSERGNNLSQGERQLLGIARAILADPRILILDEATSSVDSLTESHIQEGLIRLMKGRTSFIIAHRLSTIRNADQVLVLHNHRIVESGTHDELIGKPGGFYAKLYGMQDQKLEILESDFAAE